MAGGVGSRFWPMSTPEKPKQFIDVLGTGRTLLQLTADRFSGICPPENVWVVTAEKYRDIVKEQLPEVSDDHILLEPCMRNTAPCIAYVSWKIKARNPKANIVEISRSKFSCFCFRSYRNGRRRVCPGDSKRIGIYRIRRPDSHAGYETYPSGNRVWLYKDGAGSLRRRRNQEGGRF